MIESLDGPVGPSAGRVLAVGNFDGVHRGHQRIFSTAVELAGERGLEAALLTFSRHPLSVVHANGAPQPLMSLADRLLIARKFGFDTAVVLDFDKRMAGMAAAEFVHNVLADRLAAKAVVAGRGWRFGKGRKGDMKLLAELGRPRGVEVRAVSPVTLGGEPVSSTRVRKALAGGEVEAARDLLGRPHFVRGTVVGGQGRGRKLGYPTVNLDCHGVMVPGDGVYSGGYGFRPSGQKNEAGEPVLGPAAISVGSAPTFGHGPFAVEAHLAGIESDLYGKVVTIGFLSRLRDQRSFPDADSLIAQIAGDVRKSRESYRDSAMEGVPL